MKDDKLSIDPYNPSYGHILSKWLVWTIVGVIVAFLVFAVTILFNWTIQKWLGTVSAAGAIKWWISASPALAMILLFIAFIWSFVWNMMISIIYGLAYSDKYYNTTKSIWHTIVVNLILFISFAPIYFIYSNNISALFMILAFHLVFALYISHNIIEYIANPNYSIVAMIGNTFGMTFFITVFLVLFKMVSSWSSIWDTQNNEIKILLSVPAALCYAIIPIVSAIWEKIYYGMFTLGTNFLYISSLSEVMIDAEDNSNSNIIWDNSSDINVDLE